MRQRADIGRGRSYIIGELRAGESHSSKELDSSGALPTGRKQLRAALAEMPPKYQKLVIDYERYADPDDGEHFLLFYVFGFSVSWQLNRFHRDTGFSTVPYDK
jgi:hypothetical protein